MVTTDHKPVLIVIAGPNGSGKTTITTQILHHEWMENAIYINPDQIANDKFGDWNSHEAIMQSVKYCEALREECLREKKSLIFETVLSADDKIDYIHKSILNCKRVSSLVDRTYIYDNSVDDQEARLLFRMVDGKVFKQYVKELPNWVHTIIP